MRLEVAGRARALSLAITLIAGLVVWAPAVAFAEKPYIIANYPVEARAKNAVAAKKRAIADGEAAAFRSLLKRLVPVTAYGQLKRLSTIEASTMLDGYAVRSERNSSTDYIASLDFIFTPDSVRKLLRDQGIPYIENQAPTIVLIPIFSKAPGAEPERQLGVWGESWKDLDLRNTLTPVNLQPLKGVIHRDTVDMLRRGDSNAERIIATEYKSELVVAAVAEIDKAAKRLHVTLTGRDAVGPLSWRSSYILADNDIVYAMDYAAVVSLGVLEGRWKSKQAVSRGGIAALSGPALPVAIQVSYDNIADWYSIRDMLQRTSGVGDIREEAVSARSAQISLRFPGGGEQLAGALVRQGLSLTNNGFEWRLRRNY